MVIFAFVIGTLYHWAQMQAAKRIRLKAEGDALRIENARLLHMVETDDLTAARSRRYMRELFARKRQDGSNAMVFLDLDNFKSVNDGYGHRAGDALLRRIADKLLAAAQEGEILFRLGGDEFCFYLQAATVPEARERAKTFLDTIRTSHVIVDGVSISRTASAGVSRVSAGQDLVGALYYADEALYAAKQAGGNIACVTEGETLRSMIARRTGPRPEELAEAIRRDEVTYFVQPIFDIFEERAVGVEALMRWVRSDGRVLLPEKFLDAMIDCQSTRNAPPLKAAARIASQFAELEDFYCAFNISAQFLEQSRGDSSALIERLLLGLDPTKTVFEIVESVVIGNPQETGYVLDQLRERGARVALDDFGTGLSNLQRLNTLNVDIVKIDRSFVQGLGTANRDTSILSALYDMSRGMGFDIVAEGVETQAELDVLQQIGITKAQGYFLGRPERAEHWQRRLQQARPVTPLPYAIYC